MTEAEVKTTAKRLANETGQPFLFVLPHGADPACDWELYVPKGPRPLQAVGVESPEAWEPPKTWGESFEERLEEAGIAYFKAVPGR